MLRIAKGLVLVVLILLGASAAQAQSKHWYLLLEGQTGPISAHSGVLVTGLTDTTEILAYGQNFYLPLDPSGVPGSLEFRPLRVLKYVDGSSPRIAQALATSETISNCVITLYELPGGAPIPLYEIELIGAQLIGVTGGGDEVGASSGSLGTETVSILFQSLKLTDFASGQSSTIP